MYKHDKYNLWMHNDSELAEFLESELVIRETIHEWPNSGVQKLLLKDGRAFIYKYQSGGIIESEFYEKAISPILPEVRTLWRDEWYSCMIIEFVKEPLLGKSVLDRNSLERISHHIIENIQMIKGEYPVLLDISSFSKWEVMLSEIKSAWGDLIKTGKFHFNFDDIHLVEKVSLSSSIRSLFKNKIGLVHGDLNGGNIFLTDGGYKIIDWQSCKLAPLEMDRAGFFSRQGIDLSGLVSSGAVCMYYITGIWWLLKCQTEIMPEDNFYQPIGYFLDRLKNC